MSLTAPPPQFSLARIRFLFKIESNSEFQLGMKSKSNPFFWVFQQELSDNYFYESAEKISFFFEGMNWFVNL